MAYSPAMPTKKRNSRSEVQIRLLGEIEVRRGGIAEVLPRSKKTRALLAYLAATEKSHPRDRLGSLLWGETDDPRGALRWSLSKLRQVVDDEISRVEATRERVELNVDSISVDVLDLVAATRRQLDTLDTGALEELAASVRGEFLLGLDLPDLFEFQAWCVAMRDVAREAHCQVLRELVQRKRDVPAEALPFARQWVEADPFGIDARVEFLALLVAGGKLEEARQQYEIARRAFTEVDVDGVTELDTAWRRISNRPAGHDRAAPPEQVDVPVARSTLPTDRPFVGRRSLLDQLAEAILGRGKRGDLRVALVTGDPGAGKSRFAEELVGTARASRINVMIGRAYEAESSRPFGPWVDAFGTDVSLLLPAAGDNRTPTREGLFAAIAAVSGGQTGPEEPALLVLDDVQWLDRDSSELLHYMARTNREQPLTVLLLARRGELEDNEYLMTVLRSLRREEQLDEHALAPLTRDDIRQMFPSLEPADTDRIYEASGGNPLFAQELARAGTGGDSSYPGSLVQAIRERMDRLPVDAEEVLRWAAVLGRATTVTRLEALSSLPAEQLVDALERLEQHALLAPVEAGPSGAYRFTHDVVREAVYSELSEPRRRLMHRRVAQAFDESADSSNVGEVAHHARLGGDARLGVTAYIAAGPAGAPAARQRRGGDSGTARNRSGEPPGRGGAGRIDA